MRLVWNGRSEPKIYLVCIDADHEQAYQSFPPFWISVRPPHIMLVSAGKIYSRIMLDLNLLGLKQLMVAMDLTLFLRSEE